MLKNMVRATPTVSLNHFVYVKNKENGENSVPIASPKYILAIHLGIPLLPLANSGECLRLAISSSRVKSTLPAQIPL
jgi:hypothetical protein